MRAPTSAPVSNRQEMVWGGLLRTPGAPVPRRYLVGYVFTGAVLMWKQLNGSVQRYWAAQHSCVPSPDLRVRRSLQQNKMVLSLGVACTDCFEDRGAHFLRTLDRLCKGFLPSINPSTMPYGYKKFGRLLRSPCKMLAPRVRLIAEKRHLSAREQNCFPEAAENRPFCATLFSPRALEGSGPPGRLGMSPGCARVPR